MTVKYNRCLYYKVICWLFLRINVSYRLICSLPLLNSPLPLSRVRKEYSQLRAPPSSHRLLPGLLPFGDHGRPRGELPRLHHHRGGAQLLQQPAPPPPGPPARPRPPAQELRRTCDLSHQPPIVRVARPAQHSPAGSDW